MSCKYCEMKRSPVPNSIYSYGARYLQDDAHEARIDEDGHGRYELSITFNDFMGRKPRLSIGITHCPWCGARLEGVSE